MKLLLQRRRILVSVAIIAIFQNPLSAIESLNGTTSESSIHALLSLAVSGNHGRSLSYNDLRNFELSLDSTAATSDFSAQFEARGRSLANRERVNSIRRCFECTREGPMDIIFTGTLLPTRIGIGGEVFSLSQRPPWEHFRNSRWAFVLSRNKISTWYDPPETLKPDMGLIQMDLGRFLQSVIAREGLDIKWCRGARALTIAGPGMEGVQYTIRFRTPNDAERFGTSISQLRNNDDAQGTSISFSHFVLGRQSLLRYRRPSPEAVKVALGCSAVREFDHDAAAVNGAIHYEDALPLWSLLTGSAPCQAAEGIEGNTTDWSTTRAKLAAASSYLATMFATEYAGDQVVTDLECRTMGSVQLDALRKANRYVRHTLAREAGVVGIDDPLLLWRAFEIHTTSREAFLTFQWIYAFIHTAPVSRQIKLELCDAIADMGTPGLDGFCPDAAGDFLSEDKVISAILRSHWDWPVSETEVDSCVTELAKEDGESRTATILIEALIRTNEIDRIPFAKLRPWFLGQVANGDKETQTEALRTLSLTPKGQRYLMQRAEDNSLDESVRAAVVEMLVYRAEATTRTKRFDFLSESDCQKILALKVPSPSSH